MRRQLKCFVMIGILLMTAAGCGTLPIGPLSPGDMRLTHVRLPETMQAGVSYQLSATFEAEGQPRIKRVCFHWVSENVSIQSPSLYCYTYEVQTNQPIGAVCPRWIADGPFTNISPVYCSPVEEVVYGPTGRFVAKIPQEAVKSNFNRLECYAEYFKDGELRETNRVSARTIIEK